MDNDVPELPATLSVRFTLARPERGVGRIDPYLAGMVYVDDERPCFVELTTSEPIGDLHAAAAAADDGAPATFSIHFRTVEHPRGVQFNFDVTDFLESAVRAYFAMRPDDEPIADPRPRGGEST